MEACKSLGKISGTILNWLQPKFEPKQSKMKINVWKPCRHLHWLDELWFFYLKIFWAICCQIFIYCVADLSSITWSCPKFQVLSSHFSAVNGLLSEHWANFVWWENISTPIYVQCYISYNMYWQEGLLSRILVYLVWPQIPVKLCENENPEAKKLASTTPSRLQ